MKAMTTRLERTYTCQRCGKRDTPTVPTKEEKRTVRLCPDCAEARRLARGEE